MKISEVKTENEQLWYSLDFKDGLVRGLGEVLATCDKVIQHTVGEYEKMSTFLCATKAPTKFNDSRHCRRCGLKVNHWLNNCPAKGNRCVLCGKDNHFTLLCKNETSTSGPMAGDSMDLAICSVLPESATSDSVPRQNVFRIFAEDVSNFITKIRTAQRLCNGTNATAVSNTS